MEVFKTGVCLQRIVEDTEGVAVQFFTHFWATERNLKTVSMSILALSLGTLEEGMLSVRFWNLKMGCHCQR